MNLLKIHILINVFIPILINLFIVIVSFIASVLLLALYRRIQRKKNYKEGMHANEHVTQHLDKLLEEEKKHIEIIKELPTGYLSSDIPQKMILGKSYQIKISISTNADDQNSHIRPHAAIKLGHYIQVFLPEADIDQYAFFKIIGKEKFNKKLPLFNIGLNASDKQILWQGQIIPLKSGTHILEMIIESYYPGKDDFITNINKEQEIIVRRNFLSINYIIAEYIKKHDKWFIPIIGTGIIIPILKFLFHKIFGI